MRDYKVFIVEGMKILPIRDLDRIFCEIAYILIALHLKRFSFRLFYSIFNRLRVNHLSLID